MWRVPFFQHDLGEAEAEAFRQALSSPILTTGATTAQFEKEFAQYLGLRYAIGTSSGTAALELALLAQEVGPGSEVVTTPLTFAATVLAILHCEATPVFVDVDPETGNIDPRRVEEAITPRTKAILPVHLYGLMCDMKGLSALAKANNLFLIEDSAHCIEGSLGDFKPGSVSNAACFSFYGTKNITCGEGGAIATNDQELAERLRRLSLHGVEREPVHSDPRLYRHWDIPEAGLKANLSNLSAALLLPQLKRIDANLAKREMLAGHYQSRLQQHVRWPAIHKDAHHARHLFTVWVPPERRDAILHGLNSQGIGAVINYRPIHLLKFLKDRFGFKEGNFPNAELIGASTISLPLYPGMNLEQVDLVCDVLIELVA
ncbi:Spore coat polysaccharide biosynthesis protein SpsC [Rhodospirillaceae bacterium LM-1]|nr:Spore coat polysaccharide biosynthesis protein SpsC [Rhodospirillaceae bacterium LM-1]